MTPETVKAISDAFAPVAEKIGQGAQFGWEVVVRQQIVYGYIGVLWVIIGFIGLIALAVFQVIAWRNHKKEQEISKYNDDWAVAGIVSLIFGGLAILGAIIGGATDAITHLINPGYYALDFFIHLAK